jgi:hypothetical protein
MDSSRHWCYTSRGDPSVWTSLTRSGSCTPSAVELPRVWLLTANAQAMSRIWGKTKQAMLERDHWQWSIASIPVYALFCHQIVWRITGK